MKTAVYNSPEGEDVLCRIDKVRYGAAGSSATVTVTVIEATTSHRLGKTFDAPSNRFTQIKTRHD